MSDGLNDPMVEQVEEYVLGLLDGEELASFEARLATDATFARRVQATRAALTDFALSTPAMVPKDLKERVMAHAVRQPDAPTRAPETPHAATQWRGDSADTAHLFPARSLPLPPSL